MSESVFARVGPGRFRATPLARGPWDPQAQHGGAAAALLVRELERVAGDPPLVLARLTLEFLRPVPLDELEVEIGVMRTGRRVQLLEGWLRNESGREMVRARALRLMPSEVPGFSDREPPPTPPERGEASDYPATEPTFATDAMDIRFIEGAFQQPGPACAWFRLRHPLVQGEPTSSLQRLAAAADFGNGISATVSWDDHVFINPDLTLYIEREPEGEWICLRAKTTIHPGSIGIAESVLYDLRGRVGHASQALLVARRG